MSRKQRTILLLVAFWCIVLGVVGTWYWREDRQQRLNKQLVSAIKRDDTPAALNALALGADANTRNEPKEPLWLRLWDRMRGRRRAHANGPTPLLLFLEAGPDSYRVDNPQLVRALLLHGARVDVIDEKFGTLPLWFALFCHKTATARLLIQYGANVIGRVDDETWLHMAITYSDDAGLVEMMLRRGADSNLVDAQRQTPLGMAVYKANPDTVRCLLRYRADPNVVTTIGGFVGRPLVYAERWHLTEIVDILRHSGAKK